MTPKASAAAVGSLMIRFTSSLFTEHILSIKRRHSFVREHILSINGPLRQEVRHTVTYQVPKETYHVSKETYQVPKETYQVSKEARSKAHMLSHAPCVTRVGCVFVCLYTCTHIHRHTSIHTYL